MSTQTKAEQEAALDKKMAEIRRKNQAILNRQKEIEEDKRLAARPATYTKSTNKVKDTKSPNYSSFPISLPKLHQDEPVETVSHSTPHFGESSENGRGQGQRQGQQGNQRRSRGRRSVDNQEHPSNRDENPSTKRNVPLSPPAGPKPGMRFLTDDPERFDQEVAQNNPRRQPRHQQQLQQQHEEDGYEEWRKERAQIDHDRVARHQNVTGQWKREWDQNKPNSKDSQSSTQRQQKFPDLRDKLAAKRADRKSPRTSTEGSNSDNQISPKQPSKDKRKIDVRHEKLVVSFSNEPSEPDPTDTFLTTEQQQRHNVVQDKIQKNSNAFENSKTKNSRETQNPLRTDKPEKLQSSGIIRGTRKQNSLRNSGRRKGGAVSSHHVSTGKVHGANPSIKVPVGTWHKSTTDPESGELQYDESDLQGVADEDGWEDVEEVDESWHTARSPSKQPATPASTPTQHDMSNSSNTNMDYNHRNITDDSVINNDTLENDIENNNNHHNNDNSVLVVDDLEEEVVEGRVGRRFRTESWDTIEREMINTLNKNIQDIEDALDESDGELDELLGTGTEVSNGDLQTNEAQVNHNHKDDSNNNTHNNDESLESATIIDKTVLADINPPVLAVDPEVQTCMESLLMQIVST